MKSDFLACLSNPVGFKGYAISQDKLNEPTPFVLDGQEYTINHGSVLIAAITSCTNTSNPRFVVHFPNNYLKFISYIIFLFWKCPSTLSSFYFHLIFLKKEVHKHYLHNYFYLHVCQSYGVGGIPLSPVTLLIHAVVSQNVTDKSCLVCFNSEKYTFRVTLSP